MADKEQTRLARMRLANQANMQKNAVYNTPSGFIKHNGEWIPVAPRQQLSVLAYVLLAIFTFTAVFGVHLFYARLKGAGIGMLLFTFLSPVIGLLSLSEVIPLVVFVAYIIFYSAYYIVTLVAGISSIQDYNAG